MKNSKASGDDLLSRNDTTVRRDIISRKDSIILSAIDIINENGIKELSIRELASRQGVSEPALYRHFKSKQDIILAVLDYYSHFDDMIIKTIEDRRMGAVEGLRFLVRAYSEYYENYPAVTAITFSFDVLRHEPGIEPSIEEIFEKRYGVIFNMAAKGISDGEFSSSLEAEDVAAMVVGLVRTMLLKWRLSHFNFPLKEKLMKALEAFLILCQTALPHMEAAGAAN